MAGNKPTTPESRYSLEVVDAICQRLANGESLISITKDKEMPGYSTFTAWLRDDIDGIQAKYARAREAQAHHMAELTLEIADDKELDPQNKRVMIDARKWYAGKMLPKKYGDRLELAGDVAVTPDYAAILAKHGLKPRNEKEEEQD